MTVPLYDDVGADPSSGLPAIINAGLESVVENADRFGLKWRIVPGVVGANAFTGSDNYINVRMDGDIVFSTAVSLIGSIVPGTRVMILLVPPTNKYIVGWIGGGSNLNVTAMQRNAAGLNVAAVTSSTTSTTSSTFVDMSGTGSVTSFKFTKLYDATRTRVKAFMYADFNAVGNNAQAEFALQANSTDYVMMKAAPGSGAWAFPSATRFIDDLDAGAYTVQARWRRSAGSGTPTRDTNAWLSIMLEEVGRPAS